MLAIICNNLFHNKVLVTLNMHNSSTLPILFTCLNPELSADSYL